MLLCYLLYGMGQRHGQFSPSIQRLEDFHNHCIWLILGASRNKQWKERLTSKDLASWFGMDKNMADIISGYQHRWLGYLARMDNSRMLKQIHCTFW